LKFEEVKSRQESLDKALAIGGKNSNQMIKLLNKLDIENFEDNRDALIKRADSFVKEFKKSKSKFSEHK